MMNAQQVFNKVADHLWTQGESSLDSTDMCSYRGANGTSCAVGCLIPDDVYTRGMESQGVHSLVDWCETQGITLPAEIPEHINMLCELQKLHDLWFKSNGVARYLNMGLSAVASQFDLEYADRQETA